MFTVQWFRAKSVLMARYTIWYEIPCKVGATKYATDEGLSLPLKKWNACQLPLVEQWKDMDDNRLFFF